MKDFENKFEKLVSRLEIDDKASSKHKDSTRFKMLAEFNKNISARDGLHRTWRTAMNSKIAKFAIAAIIIAAVIIGIANLTGKDKTKPEIVENPQQKQITPPDDNPELAVQQKLAAELKLAGALFAAGNTKGLIKLLDISEIESKIAAANYLADLSAEEALITLEKLAKDWTGEDENPFAIAADRIKAAVAKQQPGDAASNSDNSTSGNEINNAEVGLISQIVDPNSITDVYILEGALRDDGFHLGRETWLKGTKYHRMEDTRSLTIDNGVNVLVLDKIAKTAQMQKSGGRQRRGVSFEYVQSIIASVQNEEMPGSVMLVENPDGSTQAKVIQPRLLLLAEECTEKELVYSIDPNSMEDQDHYGNYFKLWVAMDTLLLDRTLSGSQPGRGEQWRFNYDEIPMEKFSLEIPKDYKKLMDPKFAGRVIDAKGNPMDNFDIYVLGYPWGSAKGKSDNQGNFEFDIPTDQSGPSGPMRCPLFVRAVSDKYPDWVGWTIIQEPTNFKNDLLDWIPGQADIEAIADSSRNCAGVWGVELIVEPACQISGIVVDRYDKPIASAAVTANVFTSDQSFSKHWSGLPGAGERGRYTVNTDDQGRYTIAGIPGFEWLGFDEGLSDKEIAERKRRRHININVSAKAKGYVSKSSRGFDVRDEFSSQSVDFVLSRADVTITGRVVNNYGVPIPNRTIYYGEGSGFASENWRTDKEGRFKLVGAPASENLQIRVGSQKPGDWGMNKATQGKEYEYYLEKIIEVGFEEGTNEYDLGEIVLEKPELVIEFEVKDTAGQPIEGLGVSIYNHRMDHYWQQQFKGNTDVDGRCVIDKYPDIEESMIGIINNSEGQPRSVQEAQRREYLLQFNSIFTDVQLIGDEVGYFVEVVVPKKSEEFTGDRVRIYGSDDQLIWPVKK